MKHLAALSLALLVFLALPACQSKITPENLARVTLGMGTKEVESILGKPASVETTELPLLSTVRYGYVEGDDSVTLVFINNKLIDKQGSIGAGKGRPDQPEPGEE